MPDEGLPKELLIFYRGEPYILRRFVDTPEYGLTCPKCGVRGTIAVHPTEGHALCLEAGADGEQLVTLRPSLVCAVDCGFHVLVDRGVARDC